MEIKLSYLWLKVRVPFGSPCPKLLANPFLKERFNEPKHRMHHGSAQISTCPLLQFLRPTIFAKRCTQIKFHICNKIKVDLNYSLLYKFFLYFQFLVCSLPTWPCFGFCPFDLRLLKQNQSGRVTSAKCHQVV